MTATLTVPAKRSQAQSEEQQQQKRRARRSSHIHTHCTPFTSALRSSFDRRLGLCKSQQAQRIILRFVVGSMMMMMMIRWRSFFLARRQWPRAIAINAVDAMSCYYYLYSRVLVRKNSVCLSFCLSGRPSALRFPLHCSSCCCFCCCCLCPSRAKANAPLVRCLTAAAPMASGPFAQ